MTKQISIAAVLVTLVAYSIYSNFDSPDRRPSDPGQVADSTMSQPLVAATVSEPGLSATIENETEVVLGLHVRKDRDCTVTLKDYVTPEGDMFSAYSCTPSNPSPTHNYSEYDNETLAGMAYSDARAAALLGHRLIDQDTGRSYELLIRATALDGGNIRHLAWLSDQAFGTVAIDGKPQLQNLQRQYELAALATRLGDDPARTAYLRNELTKNGVGLARLNFIHRRVDGLLEKMRDIQRTVLGEAAIGGQDDV
jgi:hypothetical protein